MHCLEEQDELGRLRLTHLLLHGSGDVGEVVGSEIQEGLNLQFGHLLQNEAVVCQATDTRDAITRLQYHFTD